LYEFVREGRVVDYVVERRHAVGMPEKGSPLLSGTKTIMETKKRKRTKAATFKTKTSSKMRRRCQLGLVQKEILDPNVRRRFVSFFVIKFFAHSNITFRNSDKQNKKNQAFHKKQDQQHRNRPKPPNCTCWIPDFAARRHARKARRIGIDTRCETGSQLVSRTSQSRSNGTSTLESKSYPRKRVHCYYRRRNVLDMETEERTKNNRKLEDPACKKTEISSYHVLPACQIPLPNISLKSFVSSPWSADGVPQILQRPRRAKKTTWELVFVFLLRDGRHWIENPSRRVGEKIKSSNWGV